jgi:3-hydroxybutyryl-CoA dehydrogenase
MVMSNRFVEVKELKNAKAKSSVAVIGVGLIGPGIAACSSLAGHHTVLVGRTRKKAEKGVLKARGNIEQLLENDLVSERQAATARELLSATDDLSQASRSASLIVEAITEKLEAKIELFTEIDRTIGTDTIVTSTTSGIRINEIIAGLEHAGKMASTHFWFPSHLIPLVEIVKGESTEESVLMELRETLISWGKKPVILRRDLPGQLANRIQQAIMREAISIVTSGVATPEDVDTAIKMGFGIRLPVWGPLEHLDAVGLDLGLSVQRSVVPSLDNGAEPSEHLQRLVANGFLGEKTGTGFYDWKKRDMKELAGLRDRFIMNALRFLKQ